MKDKTYTIEQIKSYAAYWLKPATCSDVKDSVIENERLQSFIHYIDMEDDSSNIDKVLEKQLKSGDVVYDPNNVIGVVRTIYGNGRVSVQQLSGDTIIQCSYDTPKVLSKLNPLFTGKLR